MTLPVYVDETLVELSAGATLVLGGDEARHAATVRRTRVGERIDVVNGRGLRVTIEVTAVEKAQITGRVLDCVNDTLPVPSVELVQALAKGGRDEQAVETATEFGVTSVTPWQADRSVSIWSDPKKRAKGVDKWAAIARTAAKQSRRSHVPDVGEVVDTAALVQLVYERSAAGEHVFICHEGAEARLADTLRATGATTAPITIVVGPEGGISDEELAQLTDAGGLPVLLGDHVLRSATAGPWAIAVVRALHSLSNVTGDTLSTDE